MGKTSGVTVFGRDDDGKPGPLNCRDDGLLRSDIVLFTSTGMGGAAGAGGRTRLAVCSETGGALVSG